MDEENEESGLAKSCLTSQNEQTLSMWGTELISMLSCGVGTVSQSQLSGS